MSTFMLHAGPRSVLLFKHAYEEEGLQWPDVDERVAPAKLLFPRSFVEAASTLPGTKQFDYSFMGSLYRPEIYPDRAWVLDFARRRFTDRSFLQLSETSPEHRRLGAFDHTGDPEGVWVPKEVPWVERDHFNPAFFRVLRQSEFALCPAGDAPWSQRFFEAIMCRAIPIVSDLAHTGRNELERSIGYKVYLRDDDHVYDSDIVEENYQLFLTHQTLIHSNDR